MAIVIGTNFGYCVMAAAAMCVQCFFEGTRVVAARKKYNVQYPDNGGGRYSDKLKDEDWVAFNNVKRVSDNYSEQIGMVLSVLILAGLYQPKLAASFGTSYVVGRFLYSMGYRSKGPKGRMAGALLMTMSFLGLVLTAGYNSVTTTLLA
ncbi:hypothetical protein EC988_009273 [Linderina pennispora]|nr:hypothetical protein EC988_009273 [Linderina pennispora]